MLFQVRPAQLHQWLSQFTQAGGVKPIVLDVREAQELRIASIAPSDQFELVHIPMGEITMRLSELDPERATACLCHHGARSMAVAQFLAQRADFETVANITGGIDAWSQELDPGIPLY